MRFVISLLVLVACSSSGSDMPPSGDHPDAPPVTGDGPPSSAACASKAAQPRDATWTLTVGGLQRTAKVHVPASYDSTKPTPLVINIHGRTHNASGQATLSHAIAKSDAEGFVVIHPEAWGSPTSWNAGGCCDPAASNHIDDVGFIAAIIDKAKTDLCLDEDRVYAMGLSNGGYLSYRLACELSDRIAAIGPVAGLLAVSTCTPSRPIPVWHAHGTADPLVSYSYVAQTIDYWVAKNHCTTTSNSYSKGDASCVTHGGCNDGADVVLCTIQDGGHQWPGGDELPFLGKKSDDIIATDAIWDFFVAHPRK